MHEYQRFVQREMNARNWNQNDVARHAGLNRQTISAIMKDEREKLNQLPDSKTIDGLARAFTVSREVVLAHVALAMGLPVKLERADVSTASNDELVSELARRLKAGDGNAEATPLTRAGVSPAPEDDGYGSFGGRARGDLDHESVNDGAGENVHPLRPDLDNMAAYRTGKETEKQRLLREEAERENESQDPDDWE